MTELHVCGWVDNFENAASKKLKRLDWIAIPIKMDGDGYAFLLDHPNGAAHFGAWIAIVEIAAKQPEGKRGIIPQGIGGICQTLSRISRIPSSIFQEVLPRLEQIGWVQVQSDEQPTATVAESADVVGDVGRKVAAHNRELQGITGKGSKSDSSTDVEGSLFLLSPHAPVYGKQWFDAEFENWWRCYWRKVEKVATRKAYEKRLKLIARKMNYSYEETAAFLTDAAISDRRRFEPTCDWDWRQNLMPTTWLNGERWNDEVSAKAKTTPRNGKPEPDPHDLGGYEVIA